MQSALRFLSSSPRPLGVMRCRLTKWMALLILLHSRRGVTECVASEKSSRDRLRLPSPIDGTSFAYRVGHAKINNDNNNKYVAASVAQEMCRFEHGLFASKLRPPRSGDAESRHVALASPFEEYTTLLLQSFLNYKGTIQHAIWQTLRTSSTSVDSRVEHASR